MSTAETYFIAWKGRRDGPFSLEELASLLQRGDIGLLHRVETAAGSMPLRQLLLTSDPARWSNLAVTPGLSKAEGPGLSRVEGPGHSAGPQNSTEPTPGRPPENPAPVQSTESNPLGLPLPSASASSRSVPSFPSAPSSLPAPRSPLSTPPSSDAPPDALRAYIVSGLAFLFPPLAWYGLKLAKNLAAQGHRQLAQNLLYLNYGLAASGLLFWILIFIFG